MLYISAVSRENAKSSSIWSQVRALSDLPQENRNFLGGLVSIRKTGNIMIKVYLTMES